MGVRRGPMVGREGADNCYFMFVSAEIQRGVRTTKLYFSSNVCTFKISSIAKLLTEIKFEIVRFVNLIISHICHRTVLFVLVFDLDG